MRFDPIVCRNRLFSPGRRQGLCMGALGSPARSVYSLRLGRLPRSVFWSGAEEKAQFEKVR